MMMEKKIWGFSAFFFSVLAMVAIVPHALWFVIIVATPLLLSGLRLVIQDAHFPSLRITPPFAHAYDGIGIMLSVFVLEFFKMLDKQGIIPLVSLLFSVCAASVSFFCVLMMVRPVNTDFGILYGLWWLSVSLGLEEFKYGWPTWIATSLGALLIIARVILESRAEVHANAATKSD